MPAVETHLTRIETRLAVLTWMMAAQLALVVTIGGPTLWLLMRIACTVGVL